MESAVASQHKDHGFNPWASSGLSVWRLYVTVSLGFYLIAYSKKDAARIDSSQSSSISENADYYMQHRQRRNIRPT